MRWIDNIITSLTMLTLALLFLVALATAAGTHVLQLRLESWHYDCHFGDYVRGLQIDDATTGVAVTTKHFVGYSASEGGLKTATTLLGSHKLHDLYAPPFEAAVGDGELQAVIDSYSPVTVSPSLHHARY